MLYVHYQSCYVTYFYIRLYIQQIHSTFTVEVKFDRNLLRLKIKQMFENNMIIKMRSKSPF